MIKAVKDLGFDAKSSIVLKKDQTQDFLRKVQVTVPVPCYMEYLYPLSIDHKIEEGYKKINFTPPREYLTGERIHQWIGARYHKNDGFYQRDLPDIDRIHRQQIFLKEFLKGDFNFSVLNLEKENVSSSNVISQLQDINLYYEMEIMKFDISVLNPAVLVSKKDYLGMFFLICRNKKRFIKLLFKGVSDST